MPTTVLRAIGNSAGATIPKSMLDQLNLRKGDQLFLQVVEGGLLVTPFDPTFAEAMAAYRQASSKFRNAMQELSSIELAAGSKRSGGSKPRRGKPGRRKATAKRVSVRR